MKKLWKEHREIVIVTAVVALVRLCVLPWFPLNHDEYSSLVRTEYSSFFELIERAVKTDAHPPFLQVFLFAWTSLFGYHPAVVKLPFVCMSILSVPALYAFVIRWFSKDTGWMAAAAIGLLYVPAYYGMMARPYASGLFFIASLAYIWSVCVQSDRARFTNFLVLGFVFFLCGINQHFTALTAACIWVSGWFFIHRTNVRWYLFSTIVALGCYSFTLPIVWAQLQLKGIGGINPLPDRFFILSHLRYVFNYSLVVGVMAAVLMAIGSRKIQGHGMRWHLLFWWFAPIGIGYLYSYAIDSLLNDRSLLFSLPFLLVFLFSFLKKSTGWYTYFSLTSWLVVLLFSLFFERRMVEVNGSSALAVLPRHPKDSGELALVSMSDTFARKILQWGGEDTVLHWLHLTDTTSMAYVHSVLANSTKKQVFFGWAVHRIQPSLDYLGIVQEYYPRFIESKGFVDGEYYVFGRDSSAIHQPEVEDRWLGWSLSAPTDALGAIDVADSMEFPLSKSLVFQEYMRDQLFQFSVLLEFDEEVGDVLAVITATRETENVHWQGRSAIDTKSGGSKQVWVHSVLRVSSIDEQLGECLGSVYVWNRGKSNFRIRDVRTKLLPGNSKLFKHIEP